ncbi:unnamed protein product [Medioppia subpectinata]|uniref:Mif2/CENP-C cupin domain-containing protein n=1 Tax=Medioppia subpectinata TaxID=1979941 RepID=A0A7R9Q5L0_9ACAR|nr:unnamed protein product [Medioppia subpectinata]CAG2113863.1 unnamed protein product [Medioppia subpectinata]
MSGITWTLDPLSRVRRPRSRPPLTRNITRTRIQSYADFETLSNAPTYPSGQMTRDEFFATFTRVSNYNRRNGIRSSGAPAVDWASIIPDMSGSSGDADKDDSFMNILKNAISSTPQTSGRGKALAITPAPSSARSAAKRSTVSVHSSAKRSATKGALKPLPQLVNQMTPIASSSAKSPKIATVIRKSLNRTAKEKTPSQETRSFMQRKSFVPEYMERTVLESSPYGSPFTPIVKTMIKKKKRNQSTNNMSTFNNTTAVDNTTFFADNTTNQMHRSFRSTTTQTNDSLRRMSEVCDQTFDVPINDKSMGQSFTRKLDRYRSLETGRDIADANTDLIPGLDLSISFANKEVTENIAKQKKQSVEELIDNDGHEISAIEGNANEICIADKDLDYISAADEVFVVDEVSAVDEISAVDEVSAIDDISVVDEISSNEGEDIDKESIGDECVDEVDGEDKEEVADESDAEIAVEDEEEVDDESEAEIAVEDEEEVDDESEAEIAVEDEEEVDDESEAEIAVEDEEEVDDESDAEIAVEDKEEVDEESDAEIAGEDEEEIGAEINAVIGDEIDSVIGGADEEEIGTEIDAGIGGEVEENVAEEIDNQIEAQIGGELEEDVEEEMVGAVEAEMGGEVEEELRRSKRNRLPIMEFWRGQRAVYKRDSTGITERIVTVMEGSQDITKKRKNTKRGTKRKLDFGQKRDKEINIFDLSLHKKVKTKNDNKNATLFKSFESLVWKPSPHSEGVDIAIVNKNRAKGEVIGMVRLQELATKKKSLTADYETHLTVTYGALQLKLDDSKCIIKTGDSFTIESNTNYSLCNLRKDIAYLSFTILKD